jgi:altronate dehydratase small subunit
MPRALVLNAKDNVATLLDSAREGEDVKLSGEVSGTLRLAGDIEYGHKLAARAIKRGEPVLKYGIVIGRATHDIQQGQHVHVHNVEAVRGRGDKDKQ